MAAKCLGWSSTATIGPSRSIAATTTAAISPVAPRYLNEDAFLNHCSGRGLLPHVPRMHVMKWVAPSFNLARSDLSRIAGLWLFTAVPGGPVTGIRVALLALLVWTLLAFVRAVRRQYRAAPTRVLILGGGQLA